ncbi:MAG: DUF4352 domain-containing protein, partial [Halobacteriota archaeon]
MVASLSIAGCMSSNNPPSPNAQAASSALNTSVTGNASNSRQGVDISVSYVGSPESIGPLNATPGDGYKWFVYNVTIKDINVTDYQVMDSSFMLNLSNGNYSLTNYIVNYTEALGANNRSLTNMYTIQPGQTASGKIVFQVPTNVSPTTITYRRAFMNGTFFGEDIRTFDALAM